MSFTNFQKTIALSGGVLVLSGAIALVVFAAWTGPTAEPPLNNAPVPINVSNIDQTKAGGLTVKELSLDNGIGEGDIRNADRIIGFNDLRLRGDATEQTRIDLGVGAQEIKFYTNSQERMRIENDGDLYQEGDLYVENGNLHIKNLSDCFLEVDATGKVKCNTGGTFPGGNVLETSQAKVAEVFANESGDTDTYTILAGDAEKIVRVSLKTHTFGLISAGHFYFYINGVQKWHEWYTSTFVDYDGSKYYHVRAGDVLEISASITGPPSATASSAIYTLKSKRELITHAFADQPKILYYYEEGTIGQMDESAGTHYEAPDPSAPVSVIISAADEVDVSWFLD
jgi:hypothetical protein